MARSVVSGVAAQGEFVGVEVLEDQANDGANGFAHVPLPFRAFAQPVARFENPPIPANRIPAKPGGMHGDTTQKAPALTVKDGERQFGGVMPVLAASPDKCVCR